ncbi:hypothetical protein C8R42DRAFT_650760 [Lentinula raphanica]|nr:hypothetical protein C8R42DRAFT_650760 [Lentinula raphanica]
MEDQSKTPGPTSMSGSNAIREFFDNYPGFSYNEASETMAQFYALCDLHGWERGSEEREEALDGIRNAIALRFNAVYGSDADSLDEWHNLFRRLKIFDIPSTVKDCKERIKTIHVNICDLVDHRPMLFSSESELADYSRSTGKIYPKDNAYAGGLLRFLLRQISGPGAYHGQRRSGGHGQARGGRKSKKSNPMRPRQK